MSRQNKVNPDHYKVAGRLSTDDLARERQATRRTAPSAGAKGKPAAGAAKRAAKPPQSPRHGR